jgi:cellobiose-specific phosphotransferase system component IIB
MIPLFLYSVFCTSAGQTFSLLVSEKENAATAVQAEYNLETINDLKYQKKLIQTEIEGINKRINTTVGSLEDQYEWKNTYKIATNRKEQLEAQLNEINTQLQKAMTKAIINEDRETAIQTDNIYTFYAQFISLEPKIIQLILHITLSLFIAFMAPIGIILLFSVEHKKKKNKTVHKEKKKIDPEKINRWVQLSWSGIRQGKTKKIIPKHVFMKFLKSRGEAFTGDDYDTIKKIAQSCNIIDNDEILIYNEIEASRRISEKLN